MAAPWGGEQRSDEGTQEPLEPAQEQTEVVAGRGEHDIDAVAVVSSEVVAAHPVLGLHVADNRLDRGEAPHLASDRRDDAAHLVADPDAELLRVIAAAIGLIDVDAAGLDPGQRLRLGDDRPKVWPSRGLLCRALACSTN